jgi:hypothetical protein
VLFLDSRSLLQSENHMFQELMIEVRGSEVSIAMRGTFLKAAYRKGDAPWLVCSCRFAYDAIPPYLMFPVTI